ncbi:hypothetical protein IT157_07240 [bacterium]|jgi:hypothetical protein|nr:hypothetical protein [bacterium]
MVAKTGKASKAKTAPQKPAKSQAPAKKKSASVTKSAPKSKQTKVSIKDFSTAKGKKPVAKAVVKGETPTTKGKVAKKAVKTTHSVEELIAEAVVPVRPEELMAAPIKTKKSAAPAAVPVKKSRAKSVELDEEIEDTDRDDDDDHEGDSEGGRRAGRKEGGAKKGRQRKRSPTEEFLVEDMDEIVEEDEDVEPILDDLDPFAGTLLLDPDLIEAPITSSAPTPPVHTKRLTPRIQNCADCGGQFGWLSIEKLCFNCLKKKVSQRKKDEDYSGYGTEEASGGEEY